MRRRITPVPERWFGFLWRWRYPIWIVGLVMLIGGIAINRFVVAGWSSRTGTSAGPISAILRDGEWQAPTDYAGMGYQPDPGVRSVDSMVMLSMSDNMFGVKETVIRVQLPSETDWSSDTPGAGAARQLSSREFTGAWRAVLSSLQRHLEWRRSEGTLDLTDEETRSLIGQLEAGPGRASVARRAWLSPMLPAIGRWSPRVSYALMGLGALIVLGLHPIGILRFNTYLKRVRAKQCLKCAYPLEQSTTCPECGLDQSEMIAAVERLAQGRGFNRQNRN